MPRRCSLPGFPRAFARAGPGIGSRSDRVSHRGDKMIRKSTALAMVMALVAVAGGKASAQPTPDTIESFVTAFAAPTHITGKIARWDDGICPLTVGQQPAVTQFVSQRVKQVAAMVGAPVNADPSCKPNIEIVFSRVPQDLLDNIRARQLDYLGYAQSSAEIKELATVTRPVQAWYATQTKDLNGMGRIDSTRRTDEGIATPFARSTGNHITEGVHSAFYHIVIVADINRLAGYEAGPMADYIAMLALAQLASLDTCQPLPSIENMMAKGCEAKTGTLTANDIAYLHGLYKMTADTKLLISQKNEIADSMKTSLAAK